MPKTDIWLLRAVLYMAAPITAIGGLLMASTLLAGIGLFTGLLAYLVLDNNRRNYQQNLDTERSDQP